MKNRICRGYKAAAVNEIHGPYVLGCRGFPIQECAFALDAPTIT
jgi:hypothetical protein